MQTPDVSNSDAKRRFLDAKRRLLDAQKRRFGRGCEEQMGRFFKKRRSITGQGAFDFGRLFLKRHLKKGRWRLQVYILFLYIYLRNFLVKNNNKTAINIWFLCSQGELFKKKLQLFSMYESRIYCIGRSSRRNGHIPNSNKLPTEGSSQDS